MDEVVLAQVGDVWRHKTEHVTWRIHSVYKKYEHWLGEGECIDPGLTSVRLGKTEVGMEFFTNSWELLPNKSDSFKNLYDKLNESIPEK